MFDLGGVGILWFFIWMMFTYNRPDNHLRISIKEREFIHATIGAGQDKGRRVRELCYLYLSSPFLSLNITITEFSTNRTV